MGDLHELEADRSLHPGLAGGWGAWVLDRGPGPVLDHVRVPSSDPAVVAVLVTIAVHHTHPQSYLVQLPGLKSTQTHRQGWKQTPDGWGYIG